MTTNHIRSLPLALALASWLAPSIARADCTHIDQCDRDIDCGASSFLCIDGCCVQNVGIDQCTSNADCGYDDVCVGFMCVPETPPPTSTRL